MKRPALLRHRGVLSNWRDYAEGSIERAKALGLEVLFTFQRVETTRHLWESKKQLVEREQPWITLGLPSRAAFIEAVTGLGELAADTVIDLRQREIGISGGKAGPGRGHKTSSPTTRFASRGAAYYLARLDRDHHDDLAARVRAGELKPKTAARMAGIVKTPSPLERITQLWATLGPTDRARFLHQVSPSGEAPRRESLLDPREVNAAQVGPRQLKDPRSRAYAIQTINALKRNLESQRIDEKRVREELAEIERYRHWEILGYDSLDALLEADVGDLPCHTPLSTLEYIDELRK